MLVPLQLILKTESNSKFLKNYIRPLCVWLQGVFCALNNYSTLQRFDTNGGNCDGQQAISPCRARPEEDFSGANNYSTLQHRRSLTIERQIGTAGGRLVRHRGGAVAACVLAAESPDLLAAVLAVNPSDTLTRQAGQAEVNGKAEGNHPDAKPLLTLTVTEEQLRHLAFAVYCQTCELTEGREADEPEVQAAVRCLDAVWLKCDELKKTVQS